MPMPDWARAHGAPLFSATIRTQPQDFRVEEDLPFEFSGDGEHDYLHVEKTGANTEWVSRQLARFAGVPARDVGYAGLKDRHAVTRQWFSVPRWHAPDWNVFVAEGVRLLEVRRHNRKLRRGAHRGNAFHIVLRGDAIEKHHEAVAQRVSVIRERGVPNYFGDQRFGRDGANVGLADDWAAGKRMPRHLRSLAISTARSLMFNERLEQRVQAGDWDRVLPGDVVNLDGSNSIFTADVVDADLEARCRALDLHPAGVLWGDGAPGAAEGHEAWVAALARARVEVGWRALRLRVTALEAAPSEDAIEIRFSLPSGAFATSVLREIAEVRDRAE